MKPTRLNNHNKENGRVVENKKEKTKSIMGMLKHKIQRKPSQPLVSSHMFDDKNNKKSTSMTCDMLIDELIDNIDLVEDVDKSASFTTAKNLSTSHSSLNKSQQTCIMNDLTNIFLNNHVTDDQSKDVDEDKEYENDNDVLAALNNSTYLEGSTHDRDDEGLILDEADKSNDAHEHDDEESVDQCTEYFSYDLSDDFIDDHDYTHNCWQIFFEFLFIYLNVYDLFQTNS
jgi:hypothetical protein